MALILNIETSTTMCSVGIASKGESISIKEINEGYTHTENLHLFIEEILIQERIHPSNIDAIAVGSGPGSYTGLRIGVSTAKGLAYTLNKPLIAVNSLQTMAFAMAEKYGEGYHYCPMMDARRMEVYTAILDHNLQFVKATSAEIIDTNNLNFFHSEKPVCFFGDGMQKCKLFLEHLNGSVFVEHVFPTAKYLAKLSYQRFQNSLFEDVAYFEPFYLKDFMIGPK